MDSKYSVIDTHYDKLENSNALNPIVRTKYLKFRKFFDEGDRYMAEVEVLEKFEDEDVGFLTGFGLFNSLTTILSIIGLAVVLRPEEEEFEENCESSKHDS